MSSARKPVARPSSGTPSKHPWLLFLKYLDALSTSTRRLESLYQRQLTALAELKQSLLHHAFSGKL